MNGPADGTDGQADGTNGHADGTNGHGVNDHGVNGSQAKPSLRLSFPEYRRISNLLVLHLRRAEEGKPRLLSALPLLLPGSSLSGSLLHMTDGFVCVRVCFYRGGGGGAEEECGS